MGSSIEFKQSCTSTSIIWLREGSITARESRISSFIVLQRPKSRSGGDIDIHDTPIWEPLYRGTIERPIGPGQYVRSSFGCRAGDIIILEAGERLSTREEPDLGPRNVCFLAIVHQVQSEGATAGDPGPRMVKRCFSSLPGSRASSQVEQFFRYQSLQDLSPGRNSTPLHTCTDYTKHDLYPHILRLHTIPQYPPGESGLFILSSG